MPEFTCYHLSLILQKLKAILHELNIKLKKLLWHKIKQKIILIKRIENNQGICVIIDDIVSPPISLNPACLVLPWLSENMPKNRCEMSIVFISIRVRSVNTRQIKTMRIQQHTSSAKKRSKPVGCHILLEIRQYRDVLPQTSCCFQFDTWNAGSAPYVCCHPKDLVFFLHNPASNEWKHEFKWSIFICAHLCDLKVAPEG